MKKLCCLLIAVLLYTVLTAAAVGERAAGERIVRLEPANTQVITGQSILARCYAPDAEEVVLYCSDVISQNTVLDRWLTGVDAQISVTYDTPGAVTLLLSARFGEEWVDASPAKITVTAPKGELPAPKIHISSTFKRGEDVTFTLETVENAVVYSMVVADDAGNHAAVFDHYQSEYTISGDRLNNGTYHITGYVRCDGYSGMKQFSADFSVGAAGKTISLTAGQEEYLTNETISLSCLAPEAEEAILYRQGSEWKKWTGSVDTVAIDTCREETALKYSLSARYGDEWVESSEITVSVTAPFGTMPKPVLNLSSEYPAGKSVAFTVDTPEDVTEFRLVVKNAQGETAYQTNKRQEAYAIPAASLSNGFYSVSASARAVGYLGEGSAEAAFHYGEIDHTVKIEADHAPILLREPFGLRCSAPEAKEAILYELNRSGALYEMKRWSGSVDETVSYLGLLTTETKTFKLRARFDDAWVEQDVSVTPSFYTIEMKRPVIRAKASYFSNEEIAIEIESELKVVNAEISVKDAAGSMRRGMEGYDAEKGVYSIPAGALPSGEYTIQATIYAAGYLDSASASAKFKITASSKREMILETDPVSVRTGESYTVRFGAPEADEMVLYRKDGNQAEYSFFDWKPGAVRTVSARATGDKTTVYRLSARYGEEWVDAPLLTLTMETPKGKMPAPVISAQSAYTLGKEVSFQVETVSEPFAFLVTVSDAEGKVISESSDLILRDFAIEASAFQEGEYTITAEAQGKGYEGVGRAQASFTVEKENEEPASYQLSDLNYEGKNMTGKLNKKGGGTNKTHLEAKVTFYIQGNYYMGTVCEIKEDGSFTVEGVGPIVYITVVAFETDGSGERVRVDAGELFVDQQ